MKHMKQILVWLCMVCLLLGTVPAMAASDSGRIFDNAKLFSTREIASLRSAIANFQKNTGMDFVVLTTAEDHGHTQQEVADKFYDEGGFGLGEDRSGVLYYIDMYNRQEYICTTGKMIDYLTDERIERSLDVSNPRLRMGQFAGAVLALSTQINTFVNEGIPEGQYRVDADTGEMLTAPDTIAASSVLFAPSSLIVAIALICSILL